MTLSPVLFYDGVCGFCNGTVQFILRHESRHDLRFATLQGEVADRVKSRHPELDEVDSVVWLEGEGASERVYVRSRAGLKLLDYLGGWWGLLRVLWIVPTPVRDFFYDWFARRRYQWFRRYDSCLLPPPEVRARFLGLPETEVQGPAWQQR